MCRKATNIQSQIKENTDVRFPNFTVYRDNEKGSKVEVWLPRQDQLQDMLFNNINHTVKAQLKVLWKSKLDIDSITSWEQVWLQIVMFENYNMKWDQAGNQWISNCVKI